MTFGLLVWALAVAPPATAGDAWSVIDSAIAHHGGRAFAESRLRLDLCSKSGCSALDVRQDGGMYRYCAEAAPRNGSRRVCIDNETVREWLDGTPVADATTRERGLRDWVMARVYFAFLPFRLRDPAVRAQDLGVENWEGRPLDKIKVTFEAGSSTDAADEFLYWFDPDTSRLEQFAYSYERNGGGLRFRKLFNYRRVGDMLFFDQENFGVEGPVLSVDLIAPDYVQEAMRHVSTVELKNLSVDPLR